MDNRIRKNNHCIIGLPQCDNVFSSTRSCFIAYGFQDSPLEKDIICTLLSENNIEPIEAGASLSSGQYAFCTKICSKIITSQFCAVLLNNSLLNKIETPNANVNIEYGMMMGFNKYIIPFQKEDQKLPFNVAGLDTIKYNNSNFKVLAKQAISEAIKATEQGVTSEVPIGQALDSFILDKDAMVSPLNEQGERNFYELGKPLGFHFLTDLKGFKPIYFGNFSNLRPGVVLWKIKKIEQIIQSRIDSIPEKISLGIINPEQKDFALSQIEATEIWIIVGGENISEEVKRFINEDGYNFILKVYTVEDVMTTVDYLL